MASTILRPIKKGKSKSTKDKSRNIQLQPEISNPANTTHITHIVTQPGEGLYHKLMQHKQSIYMQISLLTTALENGHIQYTSRHNKLDMTTVITILMVQVISAITTTHQCVTRDIIDKHESYRIRLKVNEKGIYENLALLVRWFDFDSRTEKEKKGEEEREKSRVMEGVKRFQEALEEVVRLVYEIHVLPEGGSGSGAKTPPMNLQRRVSIDSGSVNSVQSSEELAHPSLAALRGGDSRDRKISWSPGSGSVGVGTPIGSYRDKSMSMTPLTSRVSADMTSEGSSTSDEERRRSGSVEGHHHSPDHLRGSMSPDWDSRAHSSLSSSMAYSTSVPLRGAGTAGHTVDLPPLPGEPMDGAPPPPLPKRGEMDDRGLHVPPLPRKGHTLPRTSSQLNGLHGGNDGDMPPPLPVKKKHSAMRGQLNGHSSGHASAAARSVDGDEMPPPLPMKQKQRRHGTAGTVGSPQHTPTHHAHSLSSPVSTPYHTAQGFVTAESLARSFGTSSYYRGSGSSDGFEVGEQYQPPVPMRMESIPGVKNLVQETPPPKPPRTDVHVPNTVPQASPQHTMTPRASIAGRTAKEEEVFSAVRKYNEDLMRSKVSGPDVAPPLPLKKKTIMMYKGLLAGYTYDESLTQSLVIPGMEAPPPIPPKRRKRSVQSNQAAAMAPPSGRSVADSSAAPKPEQHSSSSAEESFNEDSEESGEPNYLELDDASGYLTFHKEDGGYTLRGGPVEALIAYAASSTKAVKHFSEAFLLTYYTFITPEELINKLLYRLEYFYKSEKSAIWQATISLLVRLLTGLNQPLVKDAQIKLTGLVYHMISDGNLKFAQLLRNALVDKLNKPAIDTRSQLTLGVTMRGSGKSTRKTLLEYSADDLAKQMTILDNELFQRVDVCEMLYWAKEQNEEKSPMLTQFTMHFNNVSQWTKVQILRKGVDMKARIKVLSHFIAIMKCLRENHNNFNSYLAILSAIESSPISRLEWPDKIQKGLEAPRQLIDNRGSFKNYREAFAEAKPPCIPYIGLYLQDLTFIEMQPSKLEKDDSAINFTKRWKQFKSVDHIRFAQTKQYTYTPDPEILSLFWNFETDVTDEALWAISHEIKPSARAQRTQHQT